MSNSMTTNNHPVGILAKILEFFGFYATSDKLTQVETTTRTAPATVRPLKRRTSDINNITTLVPSSYTEAKLVSNSIQDGTPVILNLGIMRKEEALRMIDYCTGVAHH